MSKQMFEVFEAVTISTVTPKREPGEHVPEFVKATYIAAAHFGVDVDSGGWPSGLLLAGSQEFPVDEDTERSFWTFRKRKENE